MVNQERQKLIEARGREILTKMEGNSKVSLFSKDFWYGSIMDWSMKNESFKTQMFRFVDVLPTLQSPQEITKHLKEYFADGGEQLPSVFNVGLGLGSLAPSLMAGAIRKNVTQMAKMFITGETPQETIKVLKKARQDQGLTFTVDILGEATLSEQEAAEYTERYIALIRELAAEAKNWPEHPVLDRNDKGPIPKVNVSVKLSALYSQINEVAWEQTKNTLKDRLRPLLLLAQEQNVFLNLDMEHYGIKNLTLDVFTELINEPNLKNYPHFGCVIQAYLRDALQDCERLIRTAKSRGTPFTVRLVKGAYWDTETIEAKTQGWAIPVFLNKKESDVQFEACADLLLSQFPHICVAIASHNVRSIAAAMVSAETYQVPKTAFEVQMLYGMADPIKKTLSGMGYRVREYAPMGDLIPGMAYLVRRLLENTSNESWLRGKFADGLSAEKLLQDPRQDLVPTSPDPRPHPRAFENVPLVDFTEQPHREKVQAELQRQRAQNTPIHPFVAGQWVKASNTLESATRRNPSAIHEAIATVNYADVAITEQAIASAKKALPNWRSKKMSERATYLHKLAQLMEQKRHELIATQVLEVGKPWSEADGDVAEAIDFCRYYATQALAFDKPKRQGHVPGEISELVYQSRGVTAVIAPWNFPLAILTGMTTAALVTGNTVLIKPAEQSSRVAAGLVELMLQAGFPPEVFQFLPGRGEVVGAHLTSHRDVSCIVFTGSREVGLKILAQSAHLSPGAREIKKVILELGGKNAIIVDGDADLDEAVSGVIHSAFGFAGQKCSACSRVIVLNEIFERFEARLLEAVKSLTPGSALDPKSSYGPVIDEDSYQKTYERAQSLAKTQKLLFGNLQRPEAPANYVLGPFVFSEADPQSPLGQEEFFAPILALIRARNLDDAIQIANDTDYALTGGLFSRSPAHIAKVKAELQVGNLYINRGITGALVERHPFGGSKLSGVGSKAGGPDYLLQFMEPRCLTENTMRRGFAPAEEGDELA